MPRTTRGSVYQTKTGVGIRWPEGGKRMQKGGFRTKRQAREWFDETVAPRLRRGGPSSAITFDEFCAEFLYRWEPSVVPRTARTMRERLAPVREYFGRWTLAELENAADDVARWRRSLGSEHARYRHVRAMRQVLNAAVRWRYIERNPALDFGANAQPHAEEIRPFADHEIDHIVEEMAAQDAAMVILAGETGLRTNELAALERRDVDRRDAVLIVSRRFSAGQLHKLPKTERRRRVPLTARAQEALAMIPARLDTPLLFPAPAGGHLDLDNWRLRRWYPALEAAGVVKRGPYALRHTFATRALEAGVTLFQLARVMGTSLEMVDRHYGHLERQAESGLRELLEQPRKEEAECPQRRG